MHVLARPKLREFCNKHADAATWLEAWWSVASRERWTTLRDVRSTYTATDQFQKCLIFDKGNDYRLIVKVSYANQYTHGTLLIKHFLTHAEYDKNRWKDCCK